MESNINRAKIRLLFTSRLTAEELYEYYKNSSYYLPDDNLSTFYDSVETFVETLFAGATCIHSLDTAFRHVGPTDKTAQYLLKLWGYR
jgi:hypothetical protein